MIGTLDFNENSERFTIVMENEIEYDITSGEIVVIYYKDLVFKSNIEWDNNKGIYCMAKYSELPLHSFIGHRTETI